VVVKGQNCLLALGARPFLCYSYLNQYQMTPLSFDMLECAAEFSSSQCYQGVVGIRGQELKFILVDKIDDKFTQKILRTRYTPTKI